ncbi:MAG TPA: hypothetical protein VGJ50_22490, partial [Streptosporangiaceae bacterium]
DAVIRKPVPDLPAPAPAPGRAGARLYTGPDDLRAMQDLASRTWVPGAHWHVGDLAWQHDTFPARVPDRPIRLWTAPGGTVLAWGRLGEPAHLDAALDQMLDVRGQLTRALLGGSASGPGGHRPMGADAVIRKPVPDLPAPARPRAPAPGRAAARSHTGPPGSRT